MAKNHRVCKACGKPIARVDHWHMVETTPLERFYAFIGFRPVVTHKPEHWDCKRPNLHNPTAIWGKVQRLPQDEPFTEEEMGVLR